MAVLESKTSLLTTAGNESTISGSLIVSGKFKYDNFVVLYKKPMVFSSSLYAGQNIACSTSGQYVSVCASGSIYVSSDYGDNFVRESISDNCVAISMNVTGQYQLVVSLSSAYVSNNFGQSWTKVFIVTATATNYLLLCGISPNDPGRMHVGGTTATFTSNDFGVSFFSSNVVITSTSSTMIDSNAFLSTTSGQVAYASAFNPSAGVGTGILFTVPLTTGITGITHKGGSPAVIYHVGSAGFTYTTTPDLVSFITKATPELFTNVVSCGSIIYARSASRIWTSIDSGDTWYQFYSGSPRSFAASLDGIYVYIVSQAGEIQAMRQTTTLSSLAIGSTMQSFTSSVAFVNHAVTITGASLLKIPTGVWSISTGWSLVPTDVADDTTYNNLKYGLSYTKSGYEIFSLNRRFAINLATPSNWESYADQTIISVTDPTKNIYLNALINEAPNTTGHLMNNVYITAKLLANIIRIERPYEFQTLLNNNPPYARYSADSFHAGTNRLLDESGNGRHATCVGVTSSTGTGNGATAMINYIQGSPTSTIQFPAGSLPSTCSICTISRYSGTTKGRIFQGSGSLSTDNRVYGHHVGKVGIISDGGGQRTPFLNNPTGSNIDRWVVMCYGANVAFPDNVLIDDSVPIGTSTGTSPVGTLAVNIGVVPAEGSDFQIAHVIIFTQSITAEELRVLSRTYNNFLGTGIIE